VHWAFSIESDYAPRYFSSSQGALMAPLSSTKILVALATLMDWPSESRPFQTHLLARSTGVENTFDICLRGEGDPSLTTTAFEQLLDGLVEFAQNSSVTLRNIFAHTPRLAVPVAFEADDPGKASTESVSSFMRSGCGLSIQCLICFALTYSSLADLDSALPYSIPLDAATSGAAAAQATLLTLSQNRYTIDICTNDTAVHLCADNTSTTAEPVDLQLSLAGVTVVPALPENATRLAVRLLFEAPDPPAQAVTWVTYVMDPPPPSPPPTVPPTPTPSTASPRPTWLAVGRLPPWARATVRLPVLFPHARALALVNKRLLAAGVARASYALAPCGDDASWVPIAPPALSAMTEALVNATLLEEATTPGGGEGLQTDTTGADGGLYGQALLRLGGWKAFGDRGRGLT